MKYDTKWFFNKFKKIPESRWTMGNYRVGFKCCALGHCGVRNWEDINPEAEALRKLFETHGLNIVSVNDNIKIAMYLDKHNLGGVIDGNTMSHDLFGYTPKERILTFLANIIGLELCLR